MDSSFDTRKFWLSSVALFAGILVTGLIDRYIDFDGHFGGMQPQQVQQSGRTTLDPACDPNMSHEQQGGPDAAAACQYPGSRPHLREPRGSRAPEGAL